ncbi:dUTP diphosphatase [[Mycoplasma] imitans]|uniref:dUTP diphosphatase n=1 Tax=[Mycoplasma] imitans TaxID=29560 RepID=UPI000485BED0|nr:deoxyuridine 5'-triphosphate nucleotidohydrolase [[Mycoplasma] imitans]
MINIKYSIEGGKNYTLSKAYDGDGGYDIHLPESFTIEPLETKVIDTGIIFELPHNIHAQFMVRSSIAKKGIILANTIIDSNYRGHAFLIITNASKSSVSFSEGDRIASVMIIDSRTIDANIRLNKVAPDQINKNTPRLDKAFGSSGK